MTTITGSATSQASINVTPMIDILLVLLIVFMAIASVQERGLEAAAARNADRTSSSVPDNPVVLEIAADGSLHLNSRTVGWTALHDLLTSTFASRAEPVLFLKAADSLDYSEVASAIDIARGAQIDRVAFMPR